MSRHRKHAHPGPVAAATTTKTVLASVDVGHDDSLVSAEDIRLCAYEKWVNAGKPTGDGVQFWLEAEQELVPVTRQ